MAGWRAGAGTYWIDLSGGGPEEVESWLAGLGLDRSRTEGFQVVGEAANILMLSDSIFVSYPFIVGEDASTPAHFSFLFLDRLVVTMHEPLEGSQGIDETLATRGKLREGTTAGVICALSVVHSARLRRYVAGLRKKGDLLAGRMDPDPEAVSIAEILVLKRRVLTLGSVVDEELAALEVLKICNHPVLPLANLADAFQAAIENTRATDRDIDRLDRRVSDLQHRYEAGQQEKTNRRLGLLTVLSAIFMPLTLIVGIYGMNFDFMPELHWRYGYFVVLGGMALLAGGLFWYFRSHWWPKS